MIPKKSKSTPLLLKNDSFIRITQALSQEEELAEIKEAHYASLLELAEQIAKDPTNELLLKGLKITRAMQNGEDDPEPQEEYEEANEYTSLLFDKHLNRIKDSRESNLPYRYMRIKDVEPDYDSKDINTDDEES